MSFIWMIIVGAIIGLVARAVKPGADAMGWVMTIILGIAGSFVGGLLAGVFGMDMNSGSLTFLVFSVIGAVILLFAYEFFATRRRR